jgi:hypothetical protein
LVRWAVVGQWLQRVKCLFHLARRMVRQNLRMALQIRLVQFVDFQLMVFQTHLDLDEKVQWKDLVID